MTLSSKTYDKLKWFVIVFMPCFTTFVGVVLNCFDVSCTDVVITIMTAFQAFLGGILGISCYNYNKE